MRLSLICLLNMEPEEKRTFFNFLATMLIFILG